MRGLVCFEWPKQCIYWKDPQVIRFFSEQDMGKVTLDGCAYGLKSSKGKFMRKPWVIVSNSPIVLGGLYRKCSGDHEHEEKINLED